MSGGKGKKSTTTNVEERRGPSYLEDAYRFGTDEARRLYEQGAPDFYPGQTYADFDPIQIEALQGMLQRAREGSPMVDSAKAFYQNVLDTPSGQNPYLDQLVSKYQNDANKKVMSNFIKSGRVGSGANAATAGREITNATMPLLFNQYNADQQLKYNVAGMAPGLADYDYNELARIAAVGDAYQGQTQKGIDEDMARYNYNANKQGAWLDEYLNRVYANPAQQWGTTTNTQTTSSKGGGSLLGSIAGLASMFAGGGPLAGLTMGLGTGLSGAGLGGIGHLFRSIGSTPGTYGPGY